MPNYVCTEVRREIHNSKPPCQNSWNYECRIVIHHAIPGIKHDNDSRNDANAVKPYLDRNHTMGNCVDPDLNIFGTVLSHLDRKQKAANIQRSLNILQESWRTFPNNYLKNKTSCLREFRLFSFILHSPSKILRNKE